MHVSFSHQRHTLFRISHDPVSAADCAFGQITELESLLPETLLSRDAPSCESDSQKKLGTNLIFLVIKKLLNGALHALRRCIESSNRKVAKLVV